MASTYTTSLTLTKIGNGEQSGSWGDTTNNNWQLIEDSVAGVAQVTISGVSGATLSVANGTTDQSRNAVIVVTGSASGVNAIVAPLVKKVYIISNQTTGGFALTIGATTGSTVSIANGLTTLVYCDGTNFFSGITGFTGGNLSITGTINATGTITAPVINASLFGGAANKIPYQTGSSTTNFIDAPPSSGSATILTYTPGSGFSWSTGTVSALAGGTTNSLVYQSSPGVTSFFAKPGTSDIFYLTYNGATNQFVWSTGGSVTSVSGGTNISVTGTGANPVVNINGQVAIANGGTGAATASAALTNLGGAPLNSPSFTGTVTSSGIITSTISGGYAALQANFVTMGNNTTGISSTNAGTALNFIINNALAVAAGPTQFVPGTTNTLSLGSAGLYWTTVYATNGTINISDANQKQQIAQLTAAELAVARTLKGLIRTFKFNDDVTKKGANARIHTGVIAQDVQAAFTAQGLDATRYGLFCSDTWYEVNGKVLDKDGNNYTASAPGAVSKTQLGIRYDELFAFIIAAL